MNGGVDVLDLAGRRARAWSLWEEAGQRPIDAFLAAELVEARTRWEAAGSIPGMLAAFTLPALVEFAGQGEEQAAIIAKLEYYVDHYWPIVVGEWAMPPEGWATAWASTDEQALATEVEIAFHQQIDSGA